MSLLDNFMCRVEGAESAVFLQGLVTNDVNLLVDKESHPNLNTILFLLTHHIIGVHTMCF